LVVWPSQSFLLSERDGEIPWLFWALMLSLRRIMCPIDLLVIENHGRARTSRF
jgi:hypothetical protein